MRPENHISKELPGDADDASLGPTLWEPLEESVTHIKALSRMWSHFNFNRETHDTKLQSPGLLDFKKTQAYI